MNKEEKAKQKTILNVGYCETTSEWINRIITEPDSYTHLTLPTNREV